MELNSIIRWSFAPLMALMGGLMSAGCAADNTGVVPDLLVAVDLGSVDSAGVDAGPMDAGGTAPNPDLLGVAGVYQEHLHLSRDGLYTDAALSKSTAGKLHRDASFSAMLSGPTYAQPLYVENGPGGRSLIIVATEQNQLSAFDAAGGGLVWRRALAAPVPLAKLPCGNINPLGVTGTPVIDIASRRIFVDAMTTPDAGLTKQHLIYALSVDDGTTAAGWPVDVSARATANGVAFDSAVQHQRGGLALVGGTLYVPYGGHYGDCGNFHGWVVGVPIAAPAMVMAWATRARGGGAWAPGGISSDGANLYVATGNTFGANVWSDGEAIIRLAPGPAFSQAPADYFAPSNWQALDAGDVDIGSGGAILVHVPGATPSDLVVALGKNGSIYLLDRQNLGGVGGQVATKQVSRNEIITAPVAYTTDAGTYVVFPGSGMGCPNGTSGDLIAVRIGATSPPSISVAWCATQNGKGSPMVTTTDGKNDAIVWSVGSEGDQRLHGFDGDTGAVVYAGGGAPELMAGARRFITPIAVRGRIFVATDGQLYAFTP